MPGMSRSNTGGGHWSDHHLPERWQISYRDYLTFNVKPMNFKHTGVFPEQAANWDFIREKVASAHRQVRVLNLFAYSGGATLAAAAGGAEVYHVDAAKEYGGLGQGECHCLRVGGQAYPLDRGRLRQIHPAGDSPGPPVRRHHYGSPQLWPGAQRRDLEDGNQLLSLPAGDGEAPDG